MRTPLELLILLIDQEDKDLSKLHGSEIFGRRVALATAKRLALELLPYEKETIIKAYKSALRSPGHSDEFPIIQVGQTATKSERYFNETFNKPNYLEIPESSKKEEK